MVSRFNKRGQFFGIYLAFITVFLISISLGFYYVQQGNTGSSLVSPKAILDVEDDLQKFEDFEMRDILESLTEVSGEFGEEEFKESFREEFLRKVSSDDFMTEFIFRNLTSIGGKEIGSESTIESESFFKNILYPEDNFKFEDGVLTIQRGKVGKSKILMGDSSSKVNFPIDFKFEFSKKYIISLIDEEYKLEEV